MKHSPTKSMTSAAKRGLAMAKEKELEPQIADVSMKGGKKIAAGSQISDDHVRSMAEYHAGHMGSCPAGDDAEHAEDLLWGGPGGASWAASRVAAMDATTLAESDSPDLDKLISADDPFSIEVYARNDLFDRTELKKDEDGLIWAPILRSGTLAVRPGPGGTRKQEPLVFVSGHASSPSEIGLLDLKEAFEDGAVQHVTIPKTHQNDEFENTGFIEKVKMAESTMRPGEQVILGGHRFADPDAELRVERGLIANRSCGILHGYQNTETGKTYPHVIEHVALTNKPWVTGMEPYGSDLFADDRQIVPLMLSENQPVPAPDPQRKPPVIFSTSTPREQLEQELNLADIVWGEDGAEPSLSQIQSQLYDALRDLGRSPYWDEDSMWFSVRDVRPSSALVELDYGGADPTDAWVIPFSMADGKLTLADFSQWQVVQQAWVADDDANQDKAEVQQLLDANTELSLSDRSHAITYFDVSQAERDKAHTDNNSLPDKSYPINNKKQLKSAAILASSGHGDVKAAKALIRRRAKDLGVDVTTLPGFGDDSKSAPKGKTNTSLPTDPLKRASMLRLSQQETTPTQHIGDTMLNKTLLERLDLAPEAREALEREITASERQQTELAEFRKNAKVQGTKDRLTKLANMGFEADSGFLAVVSNLLMADDGDVAVTLLSDNGQTKDHLTITQAIDKLVEAFPVDDKGRLALAAKTNLLENPLSARPDLKPDPAELDAEREVSGDDLLAQWKKDLPGLDLAIPATPAA